MGTRGRPNQNPTLTNLQPQLQLHQHPTWGTKRGKPNQNPTATSLQLQPQLQLHQHPTNSTKRGRPSQSQTLTNPQPQLQLQHHPTKDRRETPPSVLPSSKPTSGSFCYLPSSLKCEYYHTCCRGRNNPNDCPATVSFQCNIPIGAFPRWEVSRLVFRVGRYVCY